MKCPECGEEVGNIFGLTIHYIPVFITAFIFALIIIGIFKFIIWIR